MSDVIDASSYLSVLNQADSYSGTSTQKLQNTLSDMDTSTSSDDDLMDVCKSFESYFVQKVYEEMKKTVESSDDDNEYMKYFGDIYSQCIGDEVAESGSIGLAQQLYESMKRNS